MPSPASTQLAWARFVVAWLWTLGWAALACALALLIGPTRMWRHCRRPWARSTLAIVGVRVVVEGAQHFTPGAIYIANHQSLIDVVLMPAVLPREVRVVAKRQITWIPLFGWAFAAGGAVMIDRRRPKQALEQLFAGFRRLPAGWSLLIFPEGTRSYDGRLRPLRRGAIALACRVRRPLVPVGIAGAREIVAMGRTLVRPGVVRVSVGPPLDTAGWSQNALAAHVAEAERALGAALAAAGRVDPVAALAAPAAGPAAACPPEGAA